MSADDSGHVTGGAVGQHLVRREKLGVPQSARDVFDLPVPASGSILLWHRHSSVRLRFATLLCMTIEPIDPDSCERHHATFG